MSCPVLSLMLVYVAKRFDRSTCNGRPKSLVSLHTWRARYVDKSNGYGVEIEYCFTLGVIGVAVSGPEAATSGVAELLPVARQPLPVRRKPQILPFELASKQSESLWMAKSTPGDLHGHPVEPITVFLSSADVPQHSATVCWRLRNVIRALRALCALCS